MQFLAPFFFAWLLGGVKGVIRTPLEAFRPSGEFYVKRPDKLPYLPHRKTPVPLKGGLKILYQTGVSSLSSSCISLRIDGVFCFRLLWNLRIVVGMAGNTLKIIISSKFCFTLLPVVFERYYKISTIT